MSVKYLIGKKAEIVEYRDCSKLDCDDCDDHEECDYERFETDRYSGIIIDANYSQSKEDGLVLNVAILLDDGEVYSWQITVYTNIIISKDDAKELTNKLLNYVPEDEIPTGREHLLDFEA